MAARILSAVAGRLSLRAPQEQSLAHLAQALAVAPGLLGHDRDVTAVLASLKTAFPTLEDFERDFPSLCFALATGVGKTRLMGAFIAYLHLAHGINNFFVLAPNLTVYSKLIADFTRNTPKYVFKGIAEFSQQPPLIITGDNYDQSGAAIDTLPRGFAQDVRINIFNISKINAEVRGGKEPRIKRMKEVLGDSYFNYLARLPDLVLLMDESHRYRAGAGVRSINDLNPLFGLELTATPFVEAGAGKTIPFRNVVMDYPLARAMEDGFVKEPAVVTQRDFDARAHTPEQVEQTKLEDGVRLHETTKVELLTYAREQNVRVVKPFMLVIARDTAHAAQLLALIESPAFHAGRYRGKVIQVDSSRSGADEEEMIKRLLAVESVDEPTEIVIHVNMLKEGWDVTNLYTIVPLRAANARTLIEQSIGRGLRLPYGKRTGNEAVDRLNIVAHDKFQEIVDEANRADSPIRLKQLILDAPGRDDDKVSVEISSGAMTQLGLAFTADAERDAARVVMEVIAEHAGAPTSRALLAPELQRDILAQVTGRLGPTQVDLASVVAQTTAIVVQQTIDIPRIAVVPAGEVTSGYHPFTLDVRGLNLQPVAREIVGQSLRTNQQFVLVAHAGTKETRLENYIVHALRDADDIDYATHADLLYALAGEAVDHLRAKGYSDDDMHNVLATYRTLIAGDIHAQMIAHFWEHATAYEVRVSRGFTALRSCNVTAAAGHTARHFRETVVDTSKIRQMLFGGFERCLYPLQKFDSDTERRFAIILERDSLKWMKPAKGQFQIFYQSGVEQFEYVPDFVAEVDAAIYMVETKARGDIDAPDVQAKANAAARWCQHASAHSAKVGGKPWKYLLIAHDDVVESKRLVDFMRFEVPTI
jgi:type III restriction enzyme